MKKKTQETELKTIIDKKKIPIIILDPKWHELFPNEEKTLPIKNLERELTDLLKEQGRLVNEIKDMKKLKTKLLNQIVANMGDGGNEQEKKKKDKKQEVSQKIILEINEKLEAGNDELLEMPYKIKDTNQRLIVECMRLWYGVLDRNKIEIAELGEWIDATREKLKEKILLKQEKEELNILIYTYMHNLLGHDAINQFDDKLTGGKG